MTSRSVTRFGVAVFLALVATVAINGCDKREAAAKDNTTVNKPGATTAPAAVKAGAKVDDSRFSLELRSSGDYEANKEGTVEVVLECKGDWHVNDQYPHKFTPQGGDGVTYKGPVGKEGATIERLKMVMKVPVTPTRSGSVTVAGKLSFGICTDAQCVMEKADLELALNVK